VIHDGSESTYRAMTPEPGITAVEGLDSLLLAGRRSHSPRKSLIHGLLFVMYTCIER
jgi:hypothetical protein